MPQAVEISTKFGDFSMPVVHGEVYAQLSLSNLVVERLHEMERRGERTYIEGGNLCAIIEAQHPEIVATARSSGGPHKRVANRANRFLDS
jgi:hypothetical protein